ncbi:hypothetical protein NFI95_03725 [Acetobacteraceae bacterium KSS8]|uniref:Uncharacterized protein n=1 Tax=Endosaccharibacter trunci TaxID=2812733 RepID=A0ABT1W3V9_9PROT|nr:hypothetical protein [Acetobacteraceae bacterium KSS8]
MGEYVYRHDDALAAFDAGFTSRIGGGSGETGEALHSVLRQAAWCRDLRSRLLRRLRRRRVRPSPDRASVDRPSADRPSADRMSADRKSGA